MDIVEHYPKQKKINQNNKKSLKTYDIINSIFKIARIDLELYIT